MDSSFGSLVDFAQFATANRNANPWTQTKTTSKRLIKWIWKGLLRASCLVSSYKNLVYQEVSTQKLP